MKNWELFLTTSELPVICIVLLISFGLLIGSPFWFCIFHTPVLLPVERANPPWFLTLHVLVHQGQAAFDQGKTAEQSAVLMDEVGSPSGAR